MRKVFLSLSILGFIPLAEAQNTVTTDKDWTKHETVVLNSMEADFIIRIGDIDNLGFGWPEGFDPFCGRMTDAHSYPWEADENEMAGFDRILLSSKLDPSKETPCDGDGYSFTYDKVKSKPVEFKMPISAINNAEINNAYLQLFIDDFQSPSMCSKYQITLNGKRFIEAEKFINAIDQTGPVGKLISIQIPEEFYSDFKLAELKIKIDEVTGAPDGFALDFIRLLINKKRDNTCVGNVRGWVLDRETNESIIGASVTLSNGKTTTTNNQGNFEFSTIPTGLEIATASKNGYKDGFSGVDIGVGDDSPEVVIYLEKSIKTTFNNTDIVAGQTITLSNILFDQGKAELRTESKTELDKITEFLIKNPNAEIELSGHTSSEGDATVNRSLSYKRVKACKDYILLSKIDSGRIVTVGHGPDKPVATNDTEENRAKNRRVEMRVVKL